MLEFDSADDDEDAFSYKKITGLKLGNLINFGRYKVEYCRLIF